MAQTIGFRPDDELRDAIREHRNEIERETGYRPDKSDVVRNALQDYLGLGDDDAPQEKGAA